MSKEPSKPELPELFSDEEFEAVLEERKSREVGLSDHQDVRGVRQVARQSDGRPESTIEQRFPHIAQKLAALWPSEACSLYLKNLVVTDRDMRAGFPEEVIEDLIMLYEINEFRLRQEPSRGKGPAAWHLQHRQR